MEKENVIIIFGGKSTEHDISIITGLQTLSNIDREKYNAIPVYISRSGAMYTGKLLEQVGAYVDFLEDDKKFQRVALTAGSNRLFVSKNKTFESLSIKFKPSIKVDCAVICCHGVNGEDGTLQGLLELSNIPYTSPGVLASAVSMDKIAMKDCFSANKIQTVKYTYFNKGEYLLSQYEVIKNIESKLTYPMFVKPANLGSSIGISKCRNQQDLEEGIEIAINYDSRILVEESVEDSIEVNCGVLGNVDYQTASVVEYPKSWSEFLSFDEKYLQRNKAFSGKFDRDNTKTPDRNTKPEVKETSKKVVEKLPEETELFIQEVAKKVFKIFDCSGVVRIDFLVKKNTKEIYVNEINTIPGSLAFYLFKEQGYNFSTLLNRLIDIAKKEKQRRDSNKFSYQSTALMNFGEGQKINKINE